MKRSIYPVGLCLALVALMRGVTTTWAASAPQLTEPDYTRGETAGERDSGKNFNYCSLGPIGAIANVWGGRGEKITEQTRMMQIRSVTEGTPADGVLEVNDVILGIGVKKFSSDARKALSAAITEAEKRENKGKLALNIYRPEGDPGDAKGKTMTVTITLPVAGTFSETSPWECDKTRALIDAACKGILDRGLHQENRGLRTIKGGIPTYLEVLGLLATGEAQYRPVIRDYVRELGDPEQEFSDSFSTWHISYKMLLLTEYYLATKDEYVLPAIKKTAECIAAGASDVGTFSHGSAYSFTAHGKRFKYPSAYGAMNQCSITCTMALVLARKCGVKDPEVDRVIEKALNFYRWYVDKGAIPYGDHEPGDNHDNNGVNSQAAVLFDLAGEQYPATYYARNAVSSYNIRERGHTGHFFSFQWGALGAARAGEQAAKSFCQNMSWYTELERRPDGMFEYQPQLASMDHGKYAGWSTTGSRLLQFCLPRKQLLITGKGGSCIPPITGDELNELVANGEFDPTKLTVPALLKKLSSNSPAVRFRAARELGERDDNVVEELIALLDSPDRYTRYGASEGLSFAGRGSEAAVDALVEKMQASDDLTMRYYAASAFRKKRIWQAPPIRAWKAFKNPLAMEGGAIRKAVPALLKQAATDEPGKDPMRKLPAIIAATLFYGGNAQDYTGFFPNGKGTEKLDRELLVPAIKALLVNPNGGARTTASSVFTKLTAKDLEQLWGDIYYATKYQAPSGSMAAGGVRGNGLALMVDHGVKEGIPLGIDWALRQEGWGNGARKKNGIPSLLKYRSALEPFLAEIEHVLTGWTREMKSKNNPEDAAEFKGRLADALKQPAPELKSIQPYIDATPDPLARAAQP